MARPLYEKPSDLANELTVINSVSAMAGMEFIKMPIRYSVDYALIKHSRVQAWIEIKCRKNIQSAYPTLIISAAKLMEGATLSHYSGKPFYLVVQWADKTGRIKVSDLKQFRLSVGGRKDRSDLQDIEPVYEIPVDHFEIIKTLRSNDND